MRVAIDGTHLPRFSRAVDCSLHSAGCLSFRRLAHVDEHDVRVIDKTLLPLGRWPRPGACRESDQLWPLKPKVDEVVVLILEVQSATVGPRSTRGLAL
jgi:hypothetical protein